MQSANLSQLILNTPVQLRQKGGSADLSSESMSFSQYMQKKASEESNQQNTLGPTRETQNQVDQSKREKEKVTPNESAAAFLLAVLDELKQMARDGAGTEGIFVLQGVDRQQFEALLQSMGIGADEAGSFGQLLTEIEDPLRLDDFLTMLTNRLSKLTQTEPVTIQETDLPFL